MTKAILVVSFGTTYADTRKLIIDRIEERIKESFPDYEVRRAFTAHRIIKKLKERDGIFVDNPEEAMDKLFAEGFKEIVVQPLHMIPGTEYDYVCEIVRHYERANPHIDIKLGRPVLFYKSYEEGQPDDYNIFIDVIKPFIDTEKTIVFMGHGTMHPANACYICLQEILKDQGYNNVYIASVEGYPTIIKITKLLKKHGMKSVKLMPLMLVAGEHAKNDMAGDSEDSWKSILTREGFEVEVCMKGLGEIEAFQDIYIQHIKDIIDNKFNNLGKNLKGIRSLK